MSKDFVDINTLSNWDKNPRGIKDEDYTRLKQQIEKLGQYKPLLVNGDNVVLGGNMRLRAYRELGVDKVWISRVETKTEQEMIEYALSDNDRAGYYEELALGELLFDFPELDLDTYAVDLGRQVDLPEFTSRFSGPGETDWADAFEKSGDTSKIDGYQQITFVLSEENMGLLRDKLDGYSSNKNEAIMMLVNDS